MGKTVVITGGAQGQGLSHALIFAKAGYQVVIGDILPLDDSRVQDAVEQVRNAGGEALAVVCDVASTEQVEAMFAKASETFGSIDVVISNAGIMTFGKTWELTDEKVLQTLDINLMGTWRVDKEAVKYMMKQNSGRIINTMVKTPMTQRPAFLEYLNGMKGKNYSTFEEADADMSKGRAMGVAFIEPEDVSRMVYWLATSEEARLITGAALPLDAGSML